MSQSTECHPLLVLLERLDWSLSHVEVWSTTPAWDRYCVQGEIGYAADIVGVRSDWGVCLLPANIKEGEDGFLLELKLHMECRNYEIDSRSSFGMEWPEQDEMQLWLQAFFASLPLAEDLRSHLPLPIIDSDDLSSIRFAHWDGLKPAL
jgi:hypothetical protein